MKTWNIQRVPKCGHTDLICTTVKVMRFLNIFLSSSTVSLAQTRLVQACIITINLIFKPLVQLQCLRKIIIKTLECACTKRLIMQACQVCSYVCSHLNKEKLIHKTWAEFNEEQPSTESSIEKASHSFINYLISIQRSEKGLKCMIVQGPFKQIIHNDFCYPCEHKTSVWNA
jgi:hypothetical protein